MNKKQKRLLYRMIAAALVLCGVWTADFLITLSPLLRLALFLVPYFIIGWDVLYGAIRGILQGRMLDEAFLMTVATVGAMIIGEYPEGVFVMLFYQTGELFQSAAVSKSRRAIAALAEICPDTARVITASGDVETDAEEVKTGCLIRILAGDRIPLDGVITEGTSSLDLSALTGESIPKDVQAGDAVASGAVNLTGTLSVRVTRPFTESTASRILEMVENATDRKARVERFITRFSRIYTPLVCILAVFAVFLPLLWGVKLTQSLYSALSFLVVSCPCALVISVPLTFFCGIGGAAKQGILLKGASELEALATVKGAAFDKTGTLTEGVFALSAVKTATGVSEEQLLETAAAAEVFSDHPIARSILTAYQARSGKDPLPRGKAEYHAGGGIVLTDGARKVIVGNRRLLSQMGFPLPCETQEESKTEVLVAEDGRYLGSLFIADRVKHEARDAVLALKKLDISPVFMLSGDKATTATEIGRQTEIDRVYAALLPEDKVAVLEKEQEKTPFLYVGDGINDAPCLALARCGIAMGALGADAAVMAADAVILDDNPAKVALAVRHARRVKRIVWQNILFSLAVKGLVMVAGFLSVSHMWAAVFADVGVCVIAICNAMRAARVK